MAEAENRERVLVLTVQYRIEGEMQVGPDGSLWDFKHRANEKFMTIYDAQAFDLHEGTRQYDAVVCEINKDHVVTLFREKELAFMRKEK